MITESQKTQACILLNKLKLLIGEISYVYDSKSLYTAIESAIAAGGGGADGGGGAAASGGATTSSPTDPVSITSWLETKLTELKTEINTTLIEITTQIQNNI